MRSGVLVLLLLVLLAFVLGAVLFNQGPSPQYRAAMEAQRLETAAKMSTLEVVFWYSLAGVVLLTLAGLSIAFLNLLVQRSRLIRPNDSGLFPVVRGRVGGQAYYHDPNRQLAGAVGYGRGPDGVQMQQLLPAGAESEQLQVTTQAQAAQVVTAAGQGRGMTRTTRRLVESMTQAPRPATRMPEVQVVDDASAIGVPEERHLLTAVQRDWRKDAR